MPVFAGYATMPYDAFGAEQGGWSRREGERDEGEEGARGMAEWK